MEDGGSLLLGSDKPIAAAFISLANGLALK